LLLALRLGFFHAAPNLAAPFLCAGSLVFQQNILKGVFLEWKHGLSVRGFNAENDLSQASEVIDSAGPTDRTTKVGRIAPVHVSKNLIACAEILEPSRREVLIPLEPSHAPRSMLIINENFRRKTGIPDPQSGS
jgi:hypothetical protein